MSKPSIDKVKARLRTISQLLETGHYKVGELGSLVPHRPNADNEAFSPDHYIAFILAKLEAQTWGVLYDKDLDRAVLRHFEPLFSASDLSWVKCGSPDWGTHKLRWKHNLACAKSVRKQ